MCLATCPPNLLSLHTLIGDMVFIPSGTSVVGEREPWARLLGAGETRMAFGGYRDGSEMGKPIPGQGMARRNVQPWQVCAHDCVSGSSGRGQAEIPAPWAPPSPIPLYSLPHALRTQGWGRSPPPTVLLRGARS